jgi:DNA-binding MarR family transcriptional regulator
VPRSLTRVIDTLEEAGLVHREIDPRNRRATLLRLTERGEAVRDDMRQARRRAAEDLFAPLSVEGRKTLTGLLTMIEAPPA